MDIFYDIEMLYREEVHHVEADSEVEWLGEAVVEGGPGGHHVQHPGQAHDHRQLQHDQELAGQPLAGAVWDIELSVNIREV